MANNKGEDKKSAGAIDRSKKESFLPQEKQEHILPSNKTALLIIDPVNDFLSEGGAAYNMTEKTLKLHDVIGNLRKAIEGARSRGIPILFGPMAYTREDYANTNLQKRSAINRFMYEKKMFLAGSWGADFHPELQPREGDIVLQPHKTCDVFRTDLPEHLRKLGTTHLVIAGMTANLCCESTARHAMEEGFDVTLLKDAIGATGVSEYEAAVHINFPLISNAVIKVEEFLEIIDVSSESLDTIKEGDTVWGSDHIKVGSVKEIHPESSTNKAHLLVPRGIFFKTDTYIPLDAVTKRSDGKVFLNIPRIVIGEMPWQEPPSHEEWNEKQAPPASTVKHLYGSRSPSLKQ